MVAPSPVDEVRSKHFFERYAVVFKAIVARLKYGQGPATADAAGSSQGLLCIFESMGWEIGLGVHRMIRGRFDMKEHWRAVDATSKVLLEHIADLVKGDEAAVAVDENEFVTATIRLLLNNVCSETERLGDADLVMFLGTFKELAENLVKDPTNPKYRAINNAPGECSVDAVPTFLFRDTHTESPVPFTCRKHHVPAAWAVALWTARTLLARLRERACAAIRGPSSVAVFQQSPPRNHRVGIDVGPLGAPETVNDVPVRGRGRTRLWREFHGRSVTPLAVRQRVVRRSEDHSGQRDRGPGQGDGDRR